jgi:hypothetical protein
MAKDTYKCYNCGDIKEEGSIYFQVKIITADGQMLFIPTCSEDCAKTVKTKNAEMHQCRVDDISHQCIQKTVWD